VDEPPVTFAGLLRKLRTDAGLTQEELAEAASLSPRSISDLERGINRTARKDTALLLADALNLTGPARTEFEAVARGRAPANGTRTDEVRGGMAAATRTLPRDIASFTGRELELRELVDAAGAAGSGGVVGIHAIGGMAGVGKTAFAIHAAHELAGQFPDGQIFLALHGHTPGRRPLEPADALATLLMTAGVPAPRIPPDLGSRLALWRDRLAGKQLLLILDDAADSEQVRPLLPGSGHNLVLVTSRRHLTALEDSRTISLDSLPPEDAARLLIRLAARPELDADDAAVAEITRLCAYLPLAVGMLARQLHHHPTWTPADLATDLAATRDRLSLMQAENVSVAAAFNLSYDDLGERQQRLFRRLGLHPGAEIDSYAAAALDDTGQAAVRRDLETLYDHYLLTEPKRGRYRLHDLLKEHARTLAAEQDPDHDRTQARERLYDYYQHAAELADRRLARYTRPGPGDDATPARETPDLSDRTLSLRWARAERATLLACLDEASHAGQHARVIALTAALTSLLRQDGPWADAICRHTAAVSAARYLGGPLEVANALHDLGVANYLAGDYRGAADALTESRDIYGRTGERLGQANALSNLGVVLRHLSADYAGATGGLEQALDIYRDLGDRHGQANALTNLGVVRGLTNDYGGAVEALTAAIDLARGIGDGQGQANALGNLGILLRHLGKYPEAAQAAQEALRIFRDFGDRLGQANALGGLGNVRREMGDYPDAAQALESALRIFQELGERLGQARILSDLAVVRQLTGDYQRATTALEMSLTICRDLGDRGGEVEVLNKTGTLYRVSGDLSRARDCHEQALTLAREIGGAWDEAHALAGLGRWARDAGLTAQAEASLEQAAEIFLRIGDAEAKVVSAELAALRIAARPETD
jgi:tetratricopeptide (TPR) repeat protein/transcriptional regulator with XRE-family HTH domain